MVLVAVPGVLEVTFTITVQPPEGIVVPLGMTKLPAPEDAVTPVHVPPSPVGLAIVIPAGNVSVKALVRVSAEAFVLPSVTVRPIVPPEAMAPGAAKLLATAGAPAPPRVAVLEVVPVRAAGLDAVTTPVVLFFVPTVVPVTFPWIAQEPPAASEVAPPESVSVVSPAV